MTKVEYMGFVAKKIIYGWKETTIRDIKSKKKKVCMEEQQFQNKTKKTSLPSEINLNIIMSPDILRWPIISKVDYPSLHSLYNELVPNPLK